MSISKATLAFLFGLGFGLIAFVIGSVWASTAFCSPPPGAAMTGEAGLGVAFFSLIGLAYSLKQRTGVVILSVAVALVIIMTFFIGSDSGICVGF